MTPGNDRDVTGIIVWCMALGGLLLFLVPGMFALGQMFPAASVLVLVAWLVTVLATLLAIRRFTVVLGPGRPDAARALRTAGRWLLLAAVFLAPLVFFIWILVNAP